jgi:parallel beta-helix repeat protein
MLTRFGYDNLFDSNSFHHGEGWGMEIYGARAIVRNSTIYDNMGWCIGLLGGHSDAQIYNNVCHRNGTGITTFYGSRNKIFNNTIVSHWSDAGLCVYGGSGNEFRNNILIDNGGTITDDSNGDRFTASNNLCNGTSPVCALAGTATATFANAPGNDFHLKAGGPAIDTGANLSSILTTDIEANTRSGTWDIGAYEYAGRAPGPLSAPTNLRIARQ